MLSSGDSYQDIMAVPRHISAQHRPMSMHDRAAQFSAFAALSGYGEMVSEADRLTQCRREVDDETAQKINTALNLILQSLPQRRLVWVQYFLPDRSKSGGSYVDKTGIVKHIDECERTLIFADDTRVYIDDLADIAV